MKNKNILLVGCGKMGFALLGGLVKAGVKASNIAVVEPSPAGELVASGARVLADASDVGDKFDFCILAIKPQNFDDAVRPYNFLGNGKCVFVSIAAGKTISKMEALLGNETPVARAMPNLPAMVGAGVTAVVFNSKIDLEAKVGVTELLGSVGEVVELYDEKQIDAVTAVSGSGPAYIFHLIECLQNAGEKLGLEKSVALQLAKSTVYGAGKLSVESDRSPEQLRIDVTSKGGTTEAALNVLMSDKKLENLMLDAIKAAEKRSKELQ